MRKVGLLLCTSALLLVLALPASAQYPGTTSTTTSTIAPAVLGQSLSRPSAEVQAAAAQQEPGGLLPRTGAGIAAWTAAGAVLLAGGSMLVLGARRRRGPVPGER